MELLQSMTGMRLTHLAYKGITPAFNDVMAGQVPMAFTGLAQSLPYHRNGRLRILGTTGTKRTSATTDIPTIAEQGLAGYEADSWTGVLPTNGGLVPRVVQDVQSWVGSPQSNHGWILIGKDTGSQNAKRFQSRNNAVVQTQPRLTVVYSLPEPVADDGDIPIPLWALGLLAALLIRVGMARTDHA
jgi:hypothetical protein